MVRSDTLTRHMKRKDHNTVDEESAIENLPSHFDIEEIDNAVPSQYAWKDRGVDKNHSFLLPRDVRAIVVGKSGFGKTCLVTYLLLESDMLDYDHLMVCGKSLNQPEYRIMRAAFSRGWSKSQVNKLFEHQDQLEEDPEEYIEAYDGQCKGGINATFIDDPSSIPDPSEHDPQSKNLLILDDLMIGPQSKAEDYYSRGRHNSVDTVYISQSYFRLPRQTIRENANLFFFFKQDAKNLSHIYQDHCAIDGISFATFKTFCNDVWSSGKHNYVTIDLTSPAYCGKYRRNLNDFWTPPRN